MSDNVFTQFKVAAVQAAPEFLDLEKGVAKAIRLIEEASAAGASLIAFPEVWLPGYPWWIWLDSPAWGMQFVRRYVENSLVIGSEQFERLKLAAAKNRIHVVLGFSERSNGTLYIAQAIIDDNGKVVATRRKLKPTHAERTVYGEGDGSDLAVHETSLGRLGALCCAEHIQPLSKFAMFSQHEQVHVAAWPSFRSIAVPRSSSARRRTMPQVRCTHWKVNASYWRHAPRCRKGCSTSSSTRLRRHRC